MKKLLFTLTAALIVLMLTACGSSSSGSGTTNNNNNNGVDSSNNEPVKQEEEVASITADEVLTKSVEATNELKSYSMAMVMKQTITMQGEEPVDVTSKSETDMTLEPFAMYQKTTMEEMNMVESMETETYFTEDGFFTYDPLFGGWFKFPAEFSNELMELTTMQQNPTEQLEMLKSFTDDISMDEEGNEYILTFNGSGEQYNDLINHTAASMMGETMGDMMDEVLSMMNVNSVSYVIHVNKDTFYQTKMFIKMDMEMTIEDETVHSYQELEMSLSKFNEVIDIVIPEEILQSAQEFSFDDFGDMDLEMDLEAEDVN